MPEPTGIPEETDNSLTLADGDQDVSQDPEIEYGGEDDA